MALERFIPKSPDIFIRNSQDFEVAKFGHLNTIVEYINNNSAKPAGLNGYVQFNDNTALGGDAGLFWDNVNKRLGVGTVTPSSTLIVNGVTGINNSLYLGNTDSFLSTNRFQILNAGNTLAMVNVDGGGSISTTGRFQIFNSTKTNIAQAMYYDGGTMVFRPMNDGVESTSFRNNAQTLNILNFNGVNGNVDLNFTGASLGAKLGIRGSGSTSATTSLLVRNSSSASALQIKDDLTSTFSGVSYFNARMNVNQGIQNESGANVQIFVVNNELELISNNPNNGSGSLRTTGEITRTDNQTKSIINVNNLVPSTSASFNTLNGFAFTSTITQTTGTIRGLFINPTLNASTDFRAIETVRGNVLLATTSGNVGIGNTSPTSALDVSGTILGNVVGNKNGNPVIGSDGTNIALGVNFASRIVMVLSRTDMQVNSVDVARFSSTGNTLLNSTASDTARLSIKGSGSTSATTSLLVQNSSGNTAFQVKDNLQASFGNGFGGDGIRFEAGNNSSIVFTQGGDRVGLSRTNGDQLNISFSSGTNTLIGNGGICNDGSNINYWRFESRVNTPIALDTTGYVKVFINNVAYKLAVCV